MKIFIVILFGFVVINTQNTISSGDEVEPKRSIYELCAVLNRSESAVALYVNCSNRNISDLSSVTLELNTSSLSVVELDLSYNYLTSPEGGGILSSLLHSLSYLDLSHNQINSTALTEITFKPEQDEKSNLRILNLSHNDIVSLPYNLLAPLHHLETLDLSFNPLGQLDLNTSLALSSVVSLQFMDLRGCHLKSLPASLSSLVSLRSLDLSDNQLRGLETVRVAGLTSLVIDNNHLDSLDRTSFQGLEKLHNLSVSHNTFLTTIEEDTFTHLVNLEDLRVAYNPSLYWIHPDAWSTETNDTKSEFSLKVLSLNSNNLTYLPSMLLPTFKDWYEIEFLDLQHNPWHCDCHSEWMLIDLIPAINASSPQLLAGLECGGPPGARVLGEPMFVVSQLSQDDLPCPSKANFDPWLKDFLADVKEESVVRTSRTTLVLLSLLCVGSVLATAVLVFSLHRQQQRARGRDKYSLAGRMVGVVTQWGVGYVNQDFKHDEAEMSEIRSVQPWPPVSTDE